MSYVDLGPIRQEYTPSLIGLLLLELQNAINTIDESNFPYPVSGSIIKTNTLDGSAIKTKTISLDKIKLGEWQFPLILSGTAISTTSTTGLNIGGYFYFDPSKYPDGDWYFEASIYSANSSATATALLNGGVEIGSVSTSNTGLTLVRSDKLTMPTTAQNLWVTLKTNNSSYAAYLINARLILIPI